MTHRAYARVIGAGLSGLTAAWWLRERGVAVDVLEAADRPGGLIATRRTPHGLVETAANALLWTDATAAWFARLNLAPVFPKPAARRRYFWRAGRARRWPLGPAETTAMAGRLGLAWARRAFPPRDAETMRDWAGRVVGPAAARWIVGPAFGGIYAAALADLSARAVLGRRRLGRRALAAPAGGMGEFVNRLHDALARRGVTFTFGQRVGGLDPDVPTVVATGAPAAATLLRPHAPRLAEAISRIRVAPLASVTAFYDRCAADLNGFGVLFPAGAGIRARGVLFNSEIFDGRGPARSETWMYRPDEQEDTAGGAAFEALLARDRAMLTGREDAPLAVHVHAWPAALPVYDRSVLQVRAAVDEGPPWLAIAGNYLGRIGAAALVEDTRDVIDRLALRPGR